MKTLKLFLISLVMFSASICVAKQDVANVFDLPRDLPHREIKNAYGKKTDINDFKNTFTIAVFWSKFCIPCIREMESLNNFSNKVKNDGIRVIIISPDFEWKYENEQKNFLKKYDGEDLENYTDEKGKLTSDLGIFTTPHTVLINKNGKEIGRIKGSIAWDKKEVIEYMYDIKAQSNKKIDIMPVKGIKVEELK